MQKNAELNISSSFYLLQVRDTGILTMISPQERKRQEVSAGITYQLMHTSYAYRNVFEGI